MTVTVIKRVQQVVARSVNNRVEVATKGVQGEPGTGGGGSMIGQPLFIQQTDPALVTPYIWYQTNSSGAVVDILVGP